MLRATNLSWQAGGRRIVDEVSVSFAAGEVNLILGPNGAGKSTLLRLLSGHLPADSGEIRYGDTRIDSLGARQLATFRAVLAQTVQVAFPIRVREVVMMGRYPHFGSSPS